MQVAADSLFKTLGDPTRRAIFERLNRDGEQTVRALTDRSGASRPAVSKHLAVLVRNRRQGRESHYSAQPTALKPLIHGIGLHNEFWRDRFDRLETLLDRMDQ